MNKESMSLTPRSMNNQNSESLESLPGVTPLHIENRLDLGCSKKMDRSIHSDDDSEASYEREQLLKLEIKQLKRENNFLKKKLNDLAQDVPDNQTVFSKASKLRKSKSRLGAHEEKVSSNMHKSLELFYNEVNGLLSSVSELFKIKHQSLPVCGRNTGRKSETRASSILQALDSKENENQKRDLLRPEVLNRKLERVILEKEEKRYSLLLDLFMDYYKVKSEKDAKSLSVVDEMTERAMQLNRSILERGQSRRLIRQSQIASTLDFAENMSFDGIHRENFFQKMETIEGISQAEEIMFDDSKINLHH